MKSYAWLFVVMVILLPACGKQPAVPAVPPAPEMQATAVPAAPAEAEQPVAAPVEEPAPAVTEPAPAAGPAAAAAAPAAETPAAAPAAVVATLADFETGSGIFELKGSAVIEDVAELDGRAVHMADKTANLSFWEQGGRNWSDGNCIRFDVYNPTDDRVIVPILIKDARYEEGYFWWINRNLPALKGRTTIMIDMAKTGRGEGGPKDPQDAPAFMWDRVIQMVIMGPGDVGSYYIDNIRVERADLTPPPPPDVMVLADFETGSGMLELRKEAVIETCAGLDGKAARLPAGSSFIHEKPSTDWSAYDFLRVDMFNASEENASLHVCFKDNSAPHGYYSWINRYPVIRPGRSVLELNLRELRRGEGTPKDSLDPRPFNWDNFWQFIVTVQKGEVFADNARLEKVEEITVKGLEAFDFGPPRSAVLAGFTGVSAETTYSAETGFGWKRLTSSWQRERIHPPDILFGDWVSTMNGEFAVDVPNGAYKVWIGWSDPGEWEFIQNFTRRSISAEGRLLVEETMDGKAFLDRVYRFVDVEDKPGEDVRARYCQHFSLYPYDVTVADGQLNLDIRGSGQYATTINGIVIYPEDNADAGRAFMDRVEKTRRDYYYSRWIPAQLTKQTPDPAAAAANKDKGYILFRRNPAGASSYNMSGIGYYDAPQAGEEFKDRIVMRAARGEAESAAFSIYALRDLKNITVTVSPLVNAEGQTLPPDATATNFISWKLRRAGGTGSSNEYGVQSFVLDRMKPVDADKGSPRRFYVTVRVPDTAAAGAYKGTVTVSAAGAPSSSFPLELTVLPFTLPEADLGLGIFGMGATIPWSPYGFSENAAFIEQAHRKSLAAGRDYGMTYVAIRSGNAFKELKDGKAVFDMTQVRDEYALCRSLGYTHIDIFGPYQGPFVKAAEGDLAAAQKNGFNSVEVFVKALYGGFREACASEGLPDPIWSFGDEPPDSVADKFVDMYSRVTKLAGAQTLICYSPHGEQTKRLLDTLTTSCLNMAGAEDMERAVKAGNRFYVNNQGANRWAFGVWMHELRSKGVKAYRQFAWANNHIDPFYPLDGHEDDIGMVYPDREHNLRPTERLIQIREGIDDYRYLQLMRTLAETNSGSPKAAEALAFYNGILAKAAFTHTGEGRKPQMNWEELNAMRAKAAEFIMALSAE